MVADAALWTILAIAVAFIACGCYYTRPAPKVAMDKVDRELDRAA
jgi:hypothetical protein